MIREIEDIALVFYRVDQSTAAAGVGSPGLGLQPEPQVTHIEFDRVHHADRAALRAGAGAGVAGLAFAGIVKVDWDPVVFRAGRTCRIAYCAGRALQLL